MAIFNSYVKLPEGIWILCKFIWLWLGVQKRGTVFDPHKMRKKQLRDNQPRMWGEISLAYPQPMFQSLPFSIVHKGLYMFIPSQPCINKPLLGEKESPYLCSRRSPLEGNPVSQCSHYDYVWLLLCARTLKWCGFSTTDLQLHAFQFVVSEQSSCKYPTKQTQSPVSALQSPELLQSFGHLKNSQCVPWKPSGQSQLHLGFAMPKKRHLSHCRLVVDLPLWKIWKSVGIIYYSQYMESHKSHVPVTTNRTLTIINHYQPLLTIILEAGGGWRKLAG